MDPLSITLTVVTLATAVKDVVELAQKIEDSFSKVSDNFRNAEMLASEIRQTVEELRDFYDQHEDMLTLSAAADMEKSLHDLIKDMASVYRTCSEIAPAPYNGKLGKLKVVLSAWKNRNKIESTIRELRNRVNKYHTQFMLFAIMRIEKRLVLSDRTNSQDSVTWREDTSILHLSNDKLVAFVGTSSTTLPPEINVDFISDNYLRLQVNTINELLERLSSKSYPIEQPMEAYMRPFEPVIAVLQLSDNRHYLRQEVIAQTLSIQTILSYDSASLSIQSGAWAMIDLSAGLMSLQMYHEAKVVGLWTEKLFRTLAKTNSTTYSPYLILSLLNLCWFCILLDDVDGARYAITECIDLCQTLQSSYPSLNNGLALGQAWTLSACVFALERMSTKSLEDAQKAITVFESLFEGSYAPKDTFPSPRNDAGEFEWARVLANSSKAAIHKYAQALHQLSKSYEANGQAADAVLAELRVSKILAFLVPLYPPGRLELQMAQNFYRISHEQFRPILTVDNALPMSQRSVEIFKAYFENDRLKHGEALCNALWQNAKILEEMERHDEALVVWKETANLAREVMKDKTVFANALYGVCANLRFLKRHDEAVETRRESVEVYQSVIKPASIAEAHVYYDLAVDLRLVGKYRESLQATQMAVTQYRALAFSDPVKYKKNLAVGLDLLTYSLIYAGEHEQAFNESQEALTLHQLLIQNDSSVLGDYSASLHANFFVVSVLDNPTKCIERGQAVIRHSRELVNKFPKERDSILSPSILNHSQVLSRFDRLTSAAHCIQEAVDWYEVNPADTPQATEYHIQCLIQIGSITESQGYSEKALNHFGKAVDVGLRFPTNTSVACMTVWAMHRRIQALCDLGEYSEAMIACQRIEELARQLPSDMLTYLIETLLVTSTAFIYNGQIGYALAVAEEANELCRRDAVLHLSKTAKSVLLLQPTAFRVLSKNLAAAGRETEALAYGQAAVKELSTLKSTECALPMSDLEPERISALHNLSIRLSVSGNISRALELVAQVKSYYEERAPIRNAEYIEFASVLRVEALFHCAFGQHEEGIAAKNQLKDLQTRLKSIFPSLAHLVEVRLDADRKVSLWIGHLDLQCDHQNEKQKIYAPL